MILLDELRERERETERDREREIERERETERASIPKNTLFSMFTSSLKM